MLVFTEVSTMKQLRWRQLRLLLGPFDACLGNVLTRSLGSVERFPKKQPLGWGQAALRSGRTRATLPVVADCAAPAASSGLRSMLPRDRHRTSRAEACC